MLSQMNTCFLESNLSWTTAFSSFDRAMAFCNTLYYKSFSFLLLFFHLWSLGIYLNGNLIRFYFLSAGCLTNASLSKFIWHTNCLLCGHHQIYSNLLSKLQNENVEYITDFVCLFVFKSLSWSCFLVLNPT